MKNNKFINLYNIIAYVSFIIMILSIFVYKFGGKFDLGFSNLNEDWGAFGAYFSGVTLPFIALFSVLLFALAMGQTQKLIEQQSEMLEKQNKELRFMSDRTLREDSMRYLKEIKNDIDRLLNRAVNNSGILYEFGQFVDMKLDSPAHKKALIAPNTRLANLSLLYFAGMKKYLLQHGKDLEYNAHEIYLNHIAAYLFSKILDIDETMAKELTELFEYAIPNYSKK